ncbi:MAG: type II toxin-antitoxin system VapC family toxin [Candidatus Nezhaarchaeota archaeon]|nr:type II toxin-antitoxin system VapC family toxin [Candidatus Nezhaarchaeota archaeon]
MAGPGRRVRVKELIERSFTILSLDNEAVKAHCELYRKLRGEGASIPDADLLIAAIAIPRGATLRTRDRHFERLRQ